MRKGSSLRRGPVAQQRSNPLRLNLYQKYTQQLGQPTYSVQHSHGVFQEVTDEGNSETHFFHELEQLALGRPRIAKQ